MRLHFYTSWSYIEDFNEGKDIVVWTKAYDYKTDTDLHIDVDINYYNIEPVENEPHQYKVSKKSQIDILLQQQKQF
jgi:hypothetical protein